MRGLALATISVLAGLAQPATLRAQRAKQPAKQKPQIRIGYRSEGWAGLGFAPAAWHAATKPLLDKISRKVKLRYSLQHVVEIPTLSSWMKMRRARR